MQPEDNTLKVKTVATLVSAYFSNPHVHVTPDSVPDIITMFSAQVDKLIAPTAPVAEPVKLTPAVNPKKSVTPDFLISLEDGRRYKSLKRHLRTKYNMSPEDYRAKWGLPKDYPMVAPSYAASRSALAKEMGLGRGGARRQSAPASAAAEPAAAKPARKSPVAKRKPAAKTAETPVAATPASAEA